MARAPGAVRLDALAEGGFNDADMLEYQQTRSRALLEGGFSQQDISEYWGTPEPDETPIRSFAMDTLDTFLDTTIGEDVDGERPSIGETVSQALTAGYQESVAGLIARQAEPSVAAPESLLGTTVAGVTSIIYDTPVMIPAFVGGAIAGGAVTGPLAPLGAPVGGMAAAFAVPAGMRAALIDGYRNGSYTSPQDFLERNAKVFLEMAKAAVTGGSTGAAGALARPGLQKFAAETVMLTTVQQGLEGRIPEPRDFVETAAILIALKPTIAAGTRLAKIPGEVSALRDRASQEELQGSLETIYKDTGRQPQEVLNDAIENPSIMEDVLSKNVNIPREYVETKSEAPEVFSVDTPGPVGKAPGTHTIVEGQLAPAAVKKFTALADKQKAITESVVKDFIEINPGTMGALLSDSGHLLNRMLQYSRDGYSGILEVKQKVPRLISNLKKESFQEGGGASFEVEVRKNSERRGLDKEDTPAASEILKKIEDADARAKGIDVKLEDAKSDGQRARARKEKDDVNKELGALRNDLKAETGFKTKPRPHIEQVEKLLSEFVSKQKKLPVYNEAQWLAREASVAIGEKRYNDAVKHLEDLQTIRNDPSYTQRAFEYTKNKQGQIEQFQREVVVEEPAAEVREFDVEEQKPKETVEGEEAPVKEPAPTKTPEEIAIEERAKERGEVEIEEVFDLNTPQGRVLDRISVGPGGTKPKPMDTLHLLYEQVFDALHPLNRLTKLLADGKELATGSNPYKQARLSVASATRSELMLTKEQRNFNGDVIGPALSDILAPLKNNPTETAGLRAYMVSRGQLARKDKRTKIDLKDAQEVVKAGDKKYKAMFKGLVEYSNNLLDLLVDSGRMQESMAKKAKKLNEDFIPWHLLMNEKVPQELGKVIDPLESIVKNTHTYNHLANQNHVVRSLAELAERSPELAEGVIFKTKATAKKFKVSEKELKPIADSIKERFGIEFTPEELMIFRTEQKQVKKDQQISIYRDGKREVWAVPQDVARALNGLDKATVGLVVKILQFPSKSLRAGAILNPEFTGRNIFRDSIFAPITVPGFRLGWDTLVGLGELMKRGEAYRDWLFAGGAQATIVAMDRRYLSQNIGEVLNKTQMRSSMRNLIMDEGREGVTRFSPLEALRVISEVGENVNRLGAFKRTQSNLKKNPGVNSTEFDRRAESAFRSREITDFARMGSKMQGLNMVIAFLNARLQGEDRAIRAFKDNPAKSTFIAVATITVPSILLWWSNKDDPRYQEVPQWQKDLAWIVVTDDTVWRIPKPHTLGIVFGSIPERVLNEHFNNAPDAFDGMAEAFGLDQLSGVLPNFFIPFIEEAVDHSMSRDRPIIGERLEKLVPELRQTPYTTELTKEIGRVMREIPGMELSNYTSPIIIDNFVRQWSGGLGAYTMQLLDLALRDADIIPDPVKPTTPFEKLPFVKAFTIRHPAASTIHSDEFYSRYEEKAIIHASMMALAQSGDAASARRIMAIDPSAMAQLTGIRSAMADMRKLVRLTPLLPLSPDEMRQQIDVALRAMTGMAKTGNEVMDAMEAALEGDFLAPIIDPSPPPRVESRGPALEETPAGALADLGVEFQTDETISPEGIEPSTDVLEVQPEIIQPSFNGFDPVVVKGSFAANNVVDENLLANANLINSLIHQESRGKPGAISRRKDGTPVAYGLMQILPSTAMSPGLGLEGMTGTRAQVIKKLLNPKLNLQFGTQYFNALLHRYGGNPFHALLAYHSGAGFTDNWIKDGSHINKMGKNGRDYVRLISEHLNIKKPDYAKRTQQ